MMGAEGRLFEVSTPLGFTVSVMAEQWKKIVTFKHPVISGRQRASRGHWKTLEKSGEAGKTRTCIFSTASSGPIDGFVR